MKVLSKQTNSKMCIICGLDNDSGLKASFYNMEDGSVASLFSFKEIHQSYPERVHGGMISALLDELAGRALWVTEPNLLGVTASMSVKFRKPVPYNTNLVGIGKIVRRSGKVFTAISKILDSDKNVLAEGECIYLIMPNEKISSSENLAEDVSVMVKDDIAEIDI